RLKGAPSHAPVRLALHGHGADFVARADLDVRGGVSLRDAYVSMDHGGESAHATATLVRIAPGRTSVEGLDVRGLGAPLHADLRVAPDTLVVHARSRGLDLVRLGRVAGLATAGGRLALDVDAELHRRSAEGHVTVDLRQGSLGPWRDASAHLEATLAGRKAAGSLKAAVGDVGTLDVSSGSVQLGGGSALEAASWRGAWGGADVAAHVDLAKLAPLLPAGALPGTGLSGAIEIKGRVARDSPSDTTPDVDVTAETHALAFAGKGAPWRIDGLGAALHATVDGKTGHTTLDGRLSDATGVLLSLAASSDGIPYGTVFSRATITRDDLLAIPFEATVSLPSRDVRALPAFMGMRETQGQIEARVDWKGTLARPGVEAHATLRGGRPDPAVLSLPVDLTVAAQYDGVRATASVTAVHRGQPVLEASGNVDVRAADLFSPSPPWTASGRATLSSFPLRSIAALDNRQVSGRASGTVRIDGLHRDASGSVALTFDGLEIGDVPCRATSLSLTADGQALDLSGRLAEADGYAEARAHVGATWGAALRPSLDPAAPAQVFLVAKHFRTAVLLPFVSGVLTELDGRVDANASVTVDPASRTVKPRGTLTLSDGVFEVSALGNELHDARARITMTPDGVIKLDQASARGLTGRVELAGSARLQGFDLTGARAVVQVPRKEPIPLVANGVQVGMFDGKLDIDVERTKAALAVDVDVPRMRLQLPTSARHDVQTLGAMPDVQVGIERGPGGFVPVALDGGDSEAPRVRGPVVPMRVAVRLGRDVEVKRGIDLDVRLEGGPTIDVAQTVTAKGEIRITRGSLDVQGKTFQIDKGTVTFVDDPTNPQVVLTASWAAPDGTTVFADFVGPLKTGRVTLRSDPPLGHDEILALLLYGTIDQSGSQAAGAPQLGVAGGAAGNAASEKVNRALGGLNQALDNLGLNAPISTKLDTSQATPRPEVEVQIARDITLQVAWVLGVPPPGSNPDQHLFTLDWHFLRQWSLETTVGDAGTSILDLVWQHRY
ncbi:MAG: translocation/assembly module TamB domain-containing protein, partial [Polyangiaceae bacterium]